MGNKKNHQGKIWKEKTFSAKVIPFGKTLLFLIKSLGIPKSSAKLIPLGNPNLRTNVEKPPGKNPPLFKGALN